MEESAKLITIPLAPTANTTLLFRLICYLTFAITLLIPKFSSMKQANQTYSIRPTPPGPFFAIWGVIYLNFLITSTHTLIKDNWPRSAWLCYAAWNVMVGLWTITFNSVTQEGLFVSFFLILALLLVMEKLWTELVKSNLIEGWLRIYHHNTYALCVGWLTAACNLSFGIVLVQLCDISYDTQVTIFWVMIPMTCALFYWQHYKTAPVASSVGLVLATVYAVIGAIISTAKPWPREHSI